MIYRDQAFPLSYDLAPPPSPPPRSPINKLGQRHTGRLRKRDNLQTVQGRGGGGGAKSYDSKKAGSSIIHAILSGSYIHVHCTDAIGKPKILSSSVLFPQLKHFSCKFYSNWIASYFGSFASSFCNNVCKQSIIYFKIKLWRDFNKICYDNFVRYLKDKLTSKNIF